MSDSIYKAPAQSVTVLLKHPIEVAGEPLTELVIRRPKGKDFRKLPPGVEEQPGLMLDWAATLASLPPSHMDEIDCEDVAEILEVVGDFFEGGQKTGGSS